MTTTEFKKKVAESSKVNWLNERQVSLVNEQVDLKIDIKGITAIYEFLNQQITGFSKYELKLPKEITDVKDHYTNIKDRIIEFLDTPNDYQWNQIKSQLERLNPPKLLYSSPVTEFLVKVFNDFPQYFDGAYTYVTQQSISSLSDKQRLIGSLLAYEFSTKEYSEIAKRKDAEKRSIAKIKNDFEKYLSESETHLVSYLSEANQKLADSSSQMDGIIKMKEENFNQWFKDTSHHFDSFYKITEERINDLENLYRDKLKLEAPAKYWNERAKKLRKEGYWWLLGLIACIGAGVAVLIWILNMIAEGTLTQIFSNTATAIKWSVALITLISFIAYAIRIISKLTFSSFHLVRDAEEREQLTYVYLALQKEKGIDQTERHLIMQSLFSRADTGLLKDEGAPTMPGNIMDKFTIK